MTRWTWTVAALLFGASGCLTYTPCGWDEALELGAQYEVELGELNTMESTSALYLTQLDQTRPAPTCGTLDGMASGDRVTIQLTGSPEHDGFDCSFWDAAITAPTIEFGEQLPGLINNRSYNQIIVGHQRDLGGGCAGNWEFSLSAPEDDPFERQLPGQLPIVLAYRVFAAAPEAFQACSALAGRDLMAETPGNIVCGDVWVASMTPLP